MSSAISRSIETEFEALKSSVRRLKRILGSFFLASLALIIVTGLQPANDARTVEASRFVLKDRKNRVVAVMSANEAGLPLFQMFDAEGGSRLEFGIYEQFAGLSIRDGAGTETISFSTVPGISSMLSLNQPGGRRIDLSVAGGDPGSEAEFEIGRASGPSDISLIVHPEINQFMVYSPSGEAKLGSHISLGTESTGTAFIDIRDPKWRERFSVGSGPQGDVTLKVQDAGDKLLFKAP